MQKLTSTVKANAKQGKAAKADAGGLSPELQAIMTIMDKEIGELQTLYLEPGGTTQFRLVDIESVSL
jgi:hypothetical protein